MTVTGMFTNNSGALLETEGGNLAADSAFYNLGYLNVDNGGATFNYEFLNGFGAEVTIASQGTFTLGSPSGAFDNYGPVNVNGGILDLGGMTLTIGNEGVNVEGGTVRNGYIAGSGFANVGTSGGTLMNVSLGSGVTVENSGNLCIEGNVEIDGQFTNDSECEVDIGSGAVLNILWGSGVDENSGTIDVQGGTVYAASIMGGGTLALSSGGQMTVNWFNQLTVTIDGYNSQGVSKLTLKATVGGQTPTAPVASVVLGSLSITDGGQFDVTNNGLIVNWYGSSNAYSAVWDLVQSGRDGEAWDKSGIISSTALLDTTHYGVGIADNSDSRMQLSSFLGQTLYGTDQVLIRYTYLGDTDLDGIVDATDYSNFVSGTLGSGSGWEYGDFEYAGGRPNATDFADFVAGLFEYNRARAAWTIDPRNSVARPRCWPLGRPTMPSTVGCNRIAPSPTFAKASEGRSYHLLQWRGVTPTAPLRAARGAPARCGPLTDLPPPPGDPWRRGCPRRIRSTGSPTLRSSRMTDPLPIPSNWRMATRTWPREADTGTSVFRSRSICPPPVAVTAGGTSVSWACLTSTPSAAGSVAGAAAGAG